MRYFFLSLLFAAFFLTACSDDEGTVIDAELHYDGPNLSAPFLAAGTHEAAARFTPDITGPFAGQDLTEIEFYLLSLPAQCEVRVYGVGSGTQPGNLLYSQDVTSLIRANGWIRHRLTTPVPISGDDLWLSVRVVHAVETNSVGCDPGPAKTNGDWTFSDSDNDWLTLRQRTNQEVNINWNIRGYVE